MTKQQITLPNAYTPREYQLPLWCHMAERHAASVEAKYKIPGFRAVPVWHRRAGKDATLLNWTAVAMHQRPGYYAHIAPTYKQGKKIVWNGIRADGKRHLDAFPGWDKPGSQLVTKKVEDEMTLYFRNGSIWQILGADDPDSLRGGNYFGVVKTEWAMMNPTIWDEIIEPVLAENGGWAAFPFTPKGRNHAYKFYRDAQKQMQQKQPEWFAELLTVEDTFREDGSRVITKAFIDGLRARGVNEDIIQQEYYCSFDAQISGSYYGKAMALLWKEKRITDVSWEPALPVHTAWDFGVNDDTVIIFFQIHNRSPRLIDHYSMNGEGFSHFAKIMREKPYTYGDHLAPHDIRVREMGEEATSRWETALKLGIRFHMVPRRSVQDGIEAVRALLPRCWADQTKCAKLVWNLEQYHKSWDDVNKVFRQRPDHDEHSHSADAMRTLAVGFREDLGRPVEAVVAGSDWDVFG